VVSVHGADLFEDGERLRRYPWPLRFLLFSSDAVVAPSEAFLKDCLVAFPGIVSKALFIHNGIDIEEFAQRHDPMDVVTGGRFLLCIAAHKRQKAVDVLLRAFAELTDVHRDVRLVLVGDGPLRRAHEELARSLSVQDRVDFLGWRGRAEISDLLRRCEVFVLPSRSESFGLVVAEALACRKPVVASAIGGIPEIVENGRSGVLVQPDQPTSLACELLALLEDESRQESLGRAGSERVIECFSCGTMSARYRDLYSALVRRGQRGPG
jgi:glycosyltransferase involved in cell wall biosynthesis